MNTVYDILLNHIANIDPSDTSLFVADENCDESLLATLAAIDNLQVLTNRFDIHMLCQSLNITSYLNDFDFAKIENHKEIKHCIYRISKERPVCHRIFNQISKHLVSLESFILGGKKNEGIKNYHSKPCKQLAYEGKLTKHGDSYTAVLVKNKSIEIFEPLDDKEYSELRPIESKAFKTFDDDNSASAIQAANFQIMTKPGQYGWNKVDKGSVILIENLLKSEGSSANIGSILDLGCGYGFISLALLNRHENVFPKLTTLCATDNNVAAVVSCKANLSQVNLPDIGYRVELDDCASKEHKKYDLIVCNPPFHKGFTIDSALSVKFISTAARLLHAHGEAYFVVNEFIALAKLAKSYFKNIEEITRKSGFVVYRLTQTESSL